MFFLPLASLVSARMPARLLMQTPTFPDNRPTLSSERKRLRTALVMGGVGVLLATVGAVFWYQDVRYSLPTPRPATLVALDNGQPVALPGSFAPAPDGRPLFLHFFNPDCPCSRFNADHVRSLRERFGREVHFVAVIQVEQEQDGEVRQRNLTATARLFGPETEAVVDEGGKIAAACGVYSTPQAVILAPDARRTLLFRGNYNSSRYCADPQTEFARLALEAVTGHRALPPESRSAMLAYGCELPANVAAGKSGSKDKL